MGETHSNRGIRRETVRVAPRAARTELPDAPVHPREPDCRRAPGSARGRAFGCELARAFPRRTGARPTALPARGFAAYCALQSRAPRWSEQRHEAQTAAEHLVGEGGIRPTDVPEVRVRADELDEERVPEGVLQGSERLKLAVKP